MMRDEEVVGVITIYSAEHVLDALAVQRRSLATTAAF